MNTSQAIKRQDHRVLAGLATIALAGAALAVPSAAAAHQNASSGGSSASTVAVDIADYVAARKVLWAQDRIDRAGLYR